MIPGKIYVDKNYGPNVWFGLFLRNSPEIYFGLHDDIWNWQIIKSSVIINHQAVDNYYNRREATSKELEEIYSILKSFNYTIDNTGNLVSIVQPTMLEVVNKLKNNELLSNIDKLFLINYIEKHEERNL